MKYAGPVRKKLGIRTIFNLLGPLTNPAGAKRQVLGTSKPELTEILANVLAARQASLAWVVNGHNGLCDLTITGETKVTEVREGQIRTFTVNPNDVGFETAPLDTLLVDSPQSSAEAIRTILEGNDQGPRRHHALLNAAAAIMVAGLADNLKSAVTQAAQAIDSGQAVKKLDNLAKTSNQ
jgi:anthranilate phosphoribosyltransferase